MEAYFLIVSCLAIIVQGLPLKDDETTTVQSNKDVSGFFIPLDSWENFQNQLQPKTNPPPVTTTDPNLIKLTNQPTTASPVQDTGNGNVAQQIPPITNRPTLNPQPIPSNQPIVLQPGQSVLNQVPTGGSAILIPAGNVQGNQPNQPIILVQQPSQNKPVVLSQPPNQPLYIQPGQSYVIQNGQDGKQTPVVVAVPSNNQGSYPNAQPGQNQGTVYTLVLNNQNPNTNPNGNLYLIPVQPGSSNPIILRAAK